jgi:hypothetical protein
MRFPTFLTVVVAILALAVSQAQASFQVTISDGTVPGTQSFSSPGTIVINYSDLNGILQGYFNPPTLPTDNPFNLTSSSNAPGTPALAELSTTQMFVRVADGVTVTLDVTITDTFTMPGGVDLNVSNSLSGTSHAQGGVGNFSQTTLIDGSPSPAASSGNVSGAASFGQTTTAVLDPLSPPGFTMTTSVVLKFSPSPSNGRGFDGNITDVSDAEAGPSATAPEPASFLVWGGLVVAGVVGGAVRRRRS